jgi:hypothetical protein
MHIDAENLLALGVRIFNMILAGVIDSEKGEHLRNFIPKPLIHVDLHNRAAAALRQIPQLQECFNKAISSFRYIYHVYHIAPFLYYFFRQRLSDRILIVLAVVLPFPRQGASEAGDPESKHDSRLTGATGIGDAAR